MKLTPWNILWTFIFLLGVALLFFLIFDSMKAGNVQPTTGWESHVDGPIMDIIPGDNGTLYVFSGTNGNDISAFDGNGTRKWEYLVPAAWKVRNVFAYSDRVIASGWSTTYSNDTPPESLPAGFLYLQTRLACAVEGSVLYIYVRENRITYWNHGLNEDYPPEPESGDWKLNESLLALAGNGSLLWDVPISDEHHVYEVTNVIAKDDRIYVFDDYAVTVFDNNGSALFRVENASGCPAIDDNGNIYIVPAVLVDPQPPGLTQFYHDTGLKAPANVLEAYDASGNLLWRTNVDGQVWRPGYSSLPIYQNDTLWVPVSKGIQAFNTNGSLRWAKRYETKDWPVWGGSVSLFSYMPVDSRGNAYMYEEGTGDPLASKKWYHIIALNGSESLRENLPYATYADSRNGIIIATGEHEFMNVVNVAPGSTGEVEGVPSVDMTAYDLPGNRTLWNQTIWPKTNTSVLTVENMEALRSQNIRYLHAGPGLFIVGINNGPGPVILAAGDHVLFVAYSWASYNAPFVLNWTKCIYGSEVSAFDERKGTLLWKTPFDALVTAMAAHNDTVYYGTGDGRLSARQVKV